MKVYTSYFGNYAFLKQHNILPVAICRFLPDNWDGPSIDIVAPKKELLLEYRDEHSWRRYYSKFILNIL